MDFSVDNLNYTKHKIVSGRDRLFNEHEQMVKIIISEISFQTQAEEHQLSWCEGNEIILGQNEHKMVDKEEIKN